MNIRIVLIALLLALAGPAIAQGRGTLVVHNSTDATLRITFYQDQLAVRTVEVQPQTKGDFYNALPMGRLDFEIVAPHCRPVARTNKVLWVSGTSAYPLYLSPRDFGRSVMFDAGSSAPAATSVSPVGTWIWPSGDPVQFHDSGSITIRGNAVANWIWVDTHQFRIHWKHGYTDQAVVQGDTMVGTSWANAAPNKKLRLQAQRAR